MHKLKCSACESEKDLIQVKLEDSKGKHKDHILTYCHGCLSFLHKIIQLTLSEIVPEAYKSKKDKPFEPTKNKPFVPTKNTRKVEIN